jgi:potassium/chloride transporter 9
LQATFFTFVVYVLLFLFSAATVSRPMLQNNYGFLQDINNVPPLVIMGIFAATLSAALSTLIGASRILQAGEVTVFCDVTVLCDVITR